jgi:hypothetical protein
LNPLDCLWHCVNVVFLSFLKNIEMYPRVVFFLKCCISVSVSAVSVSMPVSSSVAAGGGSVATEQRRQTLHSELWIRKLAIAYVKEVSPRNRI